MYGFMVTSHLKVFQSVAVRLAQEGYNISLLVSNGSRIVPECHALGVNTITIPRLQQSKIDEFALKMKTNEMDDNEAVYEISIMQISSIFNDQALLDHLKDSAFDMLLMGFSIDSLFLANYLKPPIHVKVVDLQPEPLIFFNCHNGPVHTSQQTAFRHFIFGI